MIRRDYASAEASSVSGAAPVAPALPARGRVARARLLPYGSSLPLGQLVGATAAALDPGGGPVAPPAPDDSQVPTAEAAAPGAAPLPPPEAELPARVPPPAPPSQDEATLWRRLQTIVRRHQERSGEQTADVPPASNATTPAPDVPPRRVQRAPAPPPGAPRAMRPPTARPLADGARSASQPGQPETVGRATLSRQPAPTARPPQPERRKTVEAAPPGEAVTQGVGAAGADVPVSPSIVERAPGQPVAERAPTGSPRVNPSTVTAPDRAPTPPPSIPTDAEGAARPAPATLPDRSSGVIARQPEERPSDAGGEYTRELGAPVQHARADEGARDVPPPDRLAGEGVAPSITPEPQIASEGEPYPEARPVAAPSQPALQATPGEPRASQPGALPSDGVLSRAMPMPAAPAGDVVAEVLTEGEEPRVAPPQRAPLQDVWPVQRRAEAPAARPLGTRHRESAAARPDTEDAAETAAIAETAVTDARAWGVAEDVELDRLSRAVPPGGPTASSVELIPPRRPRPVSQEASATPQGSRTVAAPERGVTEAPQAEPQEAGPLPGAVTPLQREPAKQDAQGEIDRPRAPEALWHPEREPALTPPAEMRAAEMRPAQTRPASARVVQTAIGPLPEDLWSLLGEQPPQDAAPTAIAPAQRMGEAMSNPPTSPSTGQEVREGAAPLAAPTSAPVVQRATEGPASAGQAGPAPSAAGTQGAAGTAREPEGGPQGAEEIDLEELAQQVYAEVRRKLDVEWERARWSA